jgi:hypothetical protein
MSGERVRRPCRDGVELGADLAPNATEAGIDRREFFGRVALVAGGIAVTAALPWPAARALSNAAWAPRAGLADWSVDDQWAPAPRYADAIGYGRPANPRLAAVESIDAAFHV